MNYIVSRLLVAVVLLALPCISVAGWEEVLEAEGFDIVETFDNLADWSENGSYNGNVVAPAALPKESDGSTPSMFGYYSNWTNGTNSSTWIGDFGAGTRINDSGKSAKIGTSAGNNAPTRLGAYIGSGTASSGYQEIYFFWRAYYPEGYYPSNLIYEKVGHIGHGFTAPLEWDGNPESYCGDGTVNKCRTPYGMSSFVPQHMYGTPSLYLRSADYYTGEYPYNQQATGDAINEGTWLAFEYRLKIDDSVDSSDEVEVWIYDEEGNATQAWLDTAVRLHNLTPSTGHKWNWFFIGGNESQGGSDYHYIDDIVIHDSRIGPTYFTALSDFIGGDTTPPAVTNPLPSGVLTAGTTQTDIGVTATDISGVSGCKYDTSDVVYGSMSGTLINSSGDVWDATVSGLSDGNSYTYYVRCIDTETNANPTSVTVDFSVSDVVQGMGEVLLGGGTSSIITQGGSSSISF